MGVFLFRDAAATLRRDEPRTVRRCDALPWSRQPALLTFVSGSIPLERPLSKPRSKVARERRLRAQMERQTQQLREAQRRLERASYSVLEGHWEIDLITRKHWVSSNYYRLLGYLPDEIDLSTTDKLEQIVHPEDVQWSKLEAQNHIDLGAPYDQELRVRVKSGEYRWFRVRGSAERDIDGKAIRLSGSIQDIHKQRRAEDELKIARERFERAIRGTQDGLWEYDILASKLWVSPRYEEILGHAEGELLRYKSRAEMVIHPDDIGIWREAQQAHSEQRAPFDVEVRMQTKSGEYRWIRARGRAERDAEGRPVRVAGSIQDVTDARAARDALVQASEAAQAANRAKSEFLANVSHEIRTPMNGILGMTALLLDTPLQDQQREYLETIRASADSLLRVINDILDFSKIEAGKLDIDVVNMNLPRTVEDAASIIAFQAAAKNLKFGVCVHPDVPRHVMGDPQRIRQCLLNLIGNAIKFTNAGEVAVEVRRTGERDGSALIRFEVRDTGIGIAPETIPSLFQPFVQADASTTRHFGGTGLGLSIVRRLVEMMGGEVGVSSELGKGSLFWFALPMRPAAEEQDCASERGLAQGRALEFGEARYCGKVPLVEDNIVNQKVGQKVLERLGCEVTVASNGEEGIRAWESGEFKLILMDVQMPVMDGYTATRKIREREGSRARTPVIALTANAMTGQLERCLEAGMDGLLTKPLETERLREILDRCGLRVATQPEPCVNAAL
jgi:two-component system sensor histidine kinase/response regulator